MYKVGDKVFYSGPYAEHGVYTYYPYSYASNCIAKISKVADDNAIQVKIGNDLCYLWVDIRDIRIPTKAELVLYGR